MHLNLSFIKKNFLGIKFPEIEIHESKILNLSQNLNTKVDISIDTRTIKKGQFYLSLKGEHFDGHDFIDDAIKKGVAGLIINESQREKFSKIKNITMIIVPDTHKFLCELATKWRQNFNIPIVGITGSVGKTTTKQMIKHILDDSKINSFISFKNQNNLIGLPLNLLKLTDEYKVAVFELGISVLGEMDKLVDMLHPTIAVVTHICAVHVQGLGNLKNIASEKFKIFKHLKNDEIGIFWGDQKILQKSFGHPVITFGRHTSNHIQSRRIKHLLFDDGLMAVSFDLHFYNQKRKVTLKVGHDGFVNNALAAASVCHFLNISFDDIVNYLATYSGFEGRFERKALKNGKGVLINDCYNASPQSMKTAIEAFDKIKSVGRKVAILGDMLELGEKQAYWHRHVGRVLAKAKTINSVILVGYRSKVISEFIPFAIKVVNVKNWQKAEFEYLKLIEDKNSLTLVKASRGIELDKLVKNVVEN